MFNSAFDVKNFSNEFELKLFSGEKHNNYCACTSCSFSENKNNINEFIKEKQFRKSSLSHDEILERLSFSMKDLFIFKELSTALRSDKFLIR